MARFQVYKDNGGEWRWRFLSTNGRIIAVSSEGYDDKRDCRRSVEIIQEESPTAPVEELTPVRV